MAHMSTARPGREPLYAIRRDKQRQLTLPSCTNTLPMRSSVSPIRPVGGMALSSVICMYPSPGRVDASKSTVSATPRSSPDLIDSCTIDLLSAPAPWDLARLDTPGRVPVSDSQEPRLFLEVAQGSGRVGGQVAQHGP